MKNTVNASVEFYFKGERYTPSATIDLDEALENTGDLPDFYLLLAKHNDIDLHSYHYEVMLLGPLQFTQAEGMVASFLVDGKLDEDGFKQAWRKYKILDQLRAIAERNLGIDNLEQHPGLKKSLLEAYDAGVSMQ